MRYLNYYFILLIISFLILEIFFRHSRFIEFSSTFSFFYFLSFLFELTFFYICIRLINIQKRHPLKISLTLAVFISFIQLINYSHYSYFGIFPNTFSILFLFDNFTQSVEILLSTISILHLLAFLFLITLYFALIKKMLKTSSFIQNKFLIGIIVTFFLILTLVINNNLKRHPAAFSSLTSSFFQTVYTADQILTGEVEEKRELFPLRHISFPKVKKSNPDFNLLLLIGESVRNKKIPETSKTATPFLDSLVNNKSVIKFNNYFANGNSTVNTLFNILAGKLSGINSSSVLIYDIVKNYTNSHTFFISPQEFYHNHSDQFYNKNLDKFLCYEKMDYDDFNGISLNDFDVVKSFKDHLDTLSSKFMGIIQFNNTHHPYTEFLNTNRFNSNKKMINKYLNCLYEHDLLIKDYFDYLSSKKLLESTVIIYVSDHGEAFDEHKHSGHLTTIYNEQVNVPLWVYLPEKFKNEKQNLLKNKDLNFSHLDIFPTILDLYNINDNFQTNFPKRKSFFGQSKNDRIIPMKGTDMLPCYGFVKDSLKFINSGKTEGEKISAFNFKEDPEEKINIFRKLSSKEQKNAHAILDSIKKLIQF